MTSSAISWESGMTLSIMSLRRTFARSITKLRLETRTSSMLWTRTFALHGPMRWMTSSAAAMIAVSALSRDDGIMIAP